MHVNKAVVHNMKQIINSVYDGQDQTKRFYVLETIARVPYFSYLSVLHLYESLGVRKNLKMMRMHYAEADNELHHLLIMESLGGSAAFADRFIAQHLAVLYYWYVVAIYILHPRAAYHLSELIEEHAYHTYDAYLHEHEDELKAQPVPEVAERYYGGSDALYSYMREDQDAGSSAAAVSKRRPSSLSSLYDVFVHIREDEAAHWDAVRAQRAIYTYMHMCLIDL